MWQLSRGMRNETQRENEVSHFSALAKPLAGGVRGVIFNGLKYAFLPYSFQPQVERDGRQCFPWESVVSEDKGES